MEKKDAHFVECMPLSGGTPDVGAYPTLQVADGTFATQQADPGLTHTLAISNVAELQAINDNLAGNYYLTNNINATGVDFVPIGQGHPTHTEFTGTLDGCGYTISNLTITDDGLTYEGTGLFGAIFGGHVANLILSDVVITSTGNNVGCLVGEGYNGHDALESPESPLIQNCHVSGTLTVTDVTAIVNIGGLIGDHSCDDGKGDGMPYVYDCTADVAITVSPSTRAPNIGGFVGGCADVIFDNCRASGDITVNSNTKSPSAGGFIGSDGGNTAEFIDCSATGDIIGYVKGGAGGFVDTILGTYTRCSARGDISCTGIGAYCGGFAAYALTGTATDCYSWGDIATTGILCHAAGFAAYASNGTLTNCYAIGEPDSANTGGLVESGSGQTYTDCFWDTETSGTETSDGGVGHITSWMQTQSNYESASWDFSSYWEMDTTEGETSKYRIEGTTIYGFNHLVGETVKLMIDGVRYDDQVVSDDGTITLSITPNSETIIKVGLAYESKLRPMKPFSQEVMMHKTVTCKQMGLSFHNTDEVTYGVDDDDMKEINFDRWKNKSDIDGLFSGSVAVSVPDGFSVNLPLQIITDSPLPCIVRAMIPKVDGD